jgi:hypothetical protein
MWKLGLRSHIYFSGNICLEFLVLCLCSVKQKRRGGCMYMASFCLLSYAQVPRPAHLLGNVGKAYYCTQVKDRL